MISIHEVPLVLIYLPTVIYIRCSCRKAHMSLTFSVSSCLTQSYVIIDMNAHTFYTQYSSIQYNHKNIALSSHPMTPYWKNHVNHEGSLLSFQSILDSASPDSAWRRLQTYPEMWKFAENLDYKFMPFKFCLTLSQNSSEEYQNVSWHIQCESHWSAYFTERLRLFFCVEINNSFRTMSSIASAVLSVSSGQLFSGMSISMKKKYNADCVKNVCCSYLPIAHGPLGDVQYSRL